MKQSNTEAMEFLQGAYMDQTLTVGKHSWVVKHIPCVPGKAGVSQKFESREDVEDIVLSVAMRAVEYKLMGGDALYKLRQTLELDTRTLAAFFGLEEGTVREWEKPDGDPPEWLVRFLFLFVEQLATRRREEREPIRQLLQNMARTIQKRACRPAPEKPTEPSSEVLYPNDSESPKWSPW